MAKQTASDHVYIEGEFVCQDYSRDLANRLYKNGIKAELFSYPTITKKTSYCTNNFCSDVAPILPLPSGWIETKTDVYHEIVFVPDYNWYIEPQYAEIFSSFCDYVKSKWKQDQTYPKTIPQGCDA